MISTEDPSLVDYALYLCFMVRLKLMFVKREGSDGKPYYRIYRIFVLVDKDHLVQ